MRRVLAAAVVLALLVAAGALVAVWWTLPPAALPAALAGAAAWAPADVDGLAVLASPGRSARWLARHPQAAGLLLLADPPGRDAAPRVEHAARALAAAVEGPVCLYWRGPELALVAELPDGARRALEALAAREDLAVAAFGSTVAVATSSALLSGPAGARPGALPDRPMAALARVGGRWWWVRATRDDLTATSGDAAAPPVLAGPSRLVTDRLGALFSPAASLGPVVPKHAHLVARDGEGWGLLLAGVRLSPTVRRLLGGGTVGAPAPGAPERWHGLLGELWFDAAGDLALATSPALLEALRAPDLAPEAGDLRGADAAYLLGRIARVADDVPGFGRAARDLRAAASQLAPLRAARWRIAANGGIIVLEW